MESRIAVSISCPLTFSCDPSIILTSLPWDEVNPVRSVKQMRPLLGAGGIPEDELDLSPLHCSMVVPAYRMCDLCFPLMASGSSVVSVIFSFICGTLSPVRLASDSTALPLSTIRSAGTIAVPSFLSLEIARLTMSPGSRSVVTVVIHSPYL